MAIPLSLLISHAPEVVSAATKIWNSWKSRQAAGSGTDANTQPAAFGARLHALEEGAEAQAKVMKDLAEQVAALTGALDAVSRRCNMAIGVAGVAFVAALVMGVMVMLR
jgi:hypothetical protein